MENKKVIKQLYVDVLISAYEDLKIKSDLIGGLTRDYIHQYFEEFIEGELKYYESIVRGISDKNQYGNWVVNKEKQFCSPLELKIYQLFRLNPELIRPMFKNLSIDVMKLYPDNILCGEIGFCQLPEDKFRFDTRTSIEIGSVVNELLLGKPDRYYKHRLNELTDRHLKHIKFKTDIDDENKEYLFKYLMGKKLQFINRYNELKELVPAEIIGETNEIKSAREMAEMVDSYIKGLGITEQNFN